MTKKEQEQIDRVEAKLDALARWLGGPVASEFVEIGLAPTTARRVKNRLRKLAAEYPRR